MIVTREAMEDASLRVGQERLMAYWVKRIALKSEEIVTERELRREENRSLGPVPVVGDEILVACHGRTFKAKVVWGNWPERKHESHVIVPLRVEEI